MRRLSAAAVVVALALTPAVLAVTPIGVLPAAAAISFRDPVARIADLPSNVRKVFAKSQRTTGTAGPAAAIPERDEVGFREKYGQPSLYDSSGRMYQPGTPGAVEYDDWFRTVVPDPSAPTPRDALRGTKTPVAGAPIESPAAAGAGRAISVGGRFLNGAGGVMAGLSAGFGVGHAGLFIWSAATGNSYEGLVCSSGDLYTGATNVLLMGLGPSCQSPVDGVTPGSVIQGGVLVYQGYSIRYVGKATGYQSGGLVTSACYRTEGSLPAGLQRTVSYPSGWLSQSTGFPCTTVSWNRTESAKGSYSTFPRYILRNASGALVAEMTEPKEVTAADAQRSPSCSISWRDGTTTTGSGTAYKETTGFPASATGLGCKSAWDAKPGAGRSVQPRTIDVNADDGSGAPKPLFSQDVPDTTPVDDDNGQGLVLRKTPAGGAEDSCNTWAVDCAGWWDATAGATNPNADGATYRCTFGTNTVDLSECGVFRRTFDSTGPVTITEPIGGKDVEWGTTPKTANSLDPSTGPGTSDSPGTQCMAEWGSAPNPIDWVLHPVKCALVWAFVPRTSVIHGTIGGIGGGTAEAGELVAPILALVDDLPSASGCDGIPVDLTFFGTEFHGRLLNACDDPTRIAAGVVNAAITLTVITMGVLSIARFAAALFGFVGPGGAFDQAQQGGGVRFRPAGGSE